MAGVSGNKSSTFRVSARCALGALLACAALSAQAQLIRCQGPDGKVTYRDTSSGPAGANCREVIDRTSVVAPLPAGGASERRGDVEGPAATSRRGMSVTPGVPATAAKPGAPAPTAGAGTAADRAARLRAAEEKLEDARDALTQQEAVRYGDERNYQRVLDRLKPFQEEVQRREQEYENLKRGIQ